MAVRTGGGKNKGKAAGFAGRLKLQGIFGFNEKWYLLFGIAKRKLSFSRLTFDLSRFSH
jgi:hypothetical protein